MKFVLKFLPPKRWQIPVLFVTGIFFGIFLFLFYISKAHSYLSDKPETCVNCHVMSPQFATWTHSSHRNHTSCIDCHVPHDNVFNKYYFKAKDGLRHSYMFALRLEPQVIFIHEAGSEVVQQNCIRCHSELLDTRLVSGSGARVLHAAGRKCGECHREVPHGRVNGLSSTPFAKVPLPKSPLTDWMNILY